MFNMGKNIRAIRFVVSMLDTTSKPDKHCQTKMCILRFLCKKDKYLIKNLCLGRKFFPPFLETILFYLVISTDRIAKAQIYPWKLRGAGKMPNLPRHPAKYLELYRMTANFCVVP